MFLAEVVGTVSAEAVGVVGEGPDASIGGLPGRLPDKLEDSGLSHGNKIIVIRSGRGGGTWEWE